MQIDTTLLTWLVFLGFFGLIGILWALNYLLEKANFYYWIGEILNKKKVMALKDFAASRAAKYSYRPQKNYYQALNNFMLFAYTSRIRITHELRGHTGIYQYTFFNYKYSSLAGKKELNLSTECTFLLLESTDLITLPNFLLGKRFLPLLSGNGSLKPAEKGKEYPQGLFSPKASQDFSELHLELQEVINIEKYGSQIIIDYDQVVPVEELPVFLDKGLKTINLLFAKEA